MIRAHGYVARGLAFGALIAAASAFAPSVAHAQRVHVLAITGLSGEPAYRLAFESAASTLADSARSRWKVPDSSLVVLAEDVNYTESGVTQRDAHDLWDMPIVFLLLVTLLGAEWFYRRRRGLA